MCEQLGKRDASDQLHYQVMELVRVADVIDDAIFTDLDVAQGVLDDIGKALADIDDKRAWLRAKWGD